MDVRHDADSRILTIPAFRSNILGNERTIRVYLPPGCDKDTGRRYPVLYVHDGQNVFTPGFNGQCWQLHRTCDRLVEEGKIEPMIVVGVDNAGAGRSSEFAHGGPHEGRLDYECRGEAYERFLIEELKPEIDRLFRTKPGSADTGLMGSSRGGLVTYHIGFRRPDVFGKIAMLSPYFAQFDEPTMSHFPIALSFDAKRPLRIWLDTGGMEGMTVRADHVRDMALRLLRLGYRAGEELAYYYDPQAAHDERTWERRVHAPLIHLFGDPGAAISSVALYSRGEAGRSGFNVWLNPVIYYESGFMMTDLNATFEVEPAGAAEAGPDGLLRPGPGDAGACTVRYVCGGKSASCKLSLVPWLSEEVRVSLEVKVPPDTPDGARLFAGIELYRNGPATFVREASLPRDTGFSFRIGLDNGMLEAAGDGGEAIRSFIADRDVRLVYDVKQWTVGRAF